MILVSFQTHIGMAFMTNAIAALAGPPALGAVITATGKYWQGTFSNRPLLRNLP